MRKPKTIIALFAMSILFANCKPRTTPIEVTKSDSIVVEKPEMPKLSEVPNKAFFKALGTEPFWGIEIYEDSIKFTTPEGKDDFSLSYEKPQKAMDANVVLYRAKSDKIDLEITIQQGKCSDGMSDKTHNYNVKVSLKRDGQKEQLLNGCGNYIIDYRLHDI